MQQVTQEEERMLGEKIVVRTLPFTNTRARYVTHSNLSEDNVEMAAKKYQYVLQEMQQANRDAGVRDAAKSS